MKKVTIKKDRETRTFYFDSQIFELLVPMPDEEQKAKLLRQMSLHLAQVPDHTTAQALFIARIYRTEKNKNENEFSVLATDNVRVNDEVDITINNQEENNQNNILIEEIEDDGNLPGDFDNATKGLYLSDIKSKLERIQTKVKAYVFSLEKAPLPPFPKKPQGPIIITDSNYADHINTLEKRLGFEPSEKVLSFPLSLDDQATRKITVAKNIRETLRNEIYDPIENNIAKLNELLNDEALTSQSKDALSRYVTSQKEQFISSYTSTKSILVQQEESLTTVISNKIDTNKISRIKEILNDIQYANSTDVRDFKYVKRCIIWALQCAAYDYINTVIWPAELSLAEKTKNYWSSGASDPNTDPHIQKMKTRQKKCSECSLFAGIANINDVFHVRLNNQEKLIDAELDNFSVFMAVFLNQQDSKSVSIVQTRLTNLNKELQKELNSNQPPFEMGNGFKFNQTVIDDLNQQERKSNNQKGVLEGLANGIRINVTQAIEKITTDVDVGKHLKTISDQAVARCQLYKNLLLERQQHEAKINTAGQLTGKVCENKIKAQEKVTSVHSNLHDSLTRIKATSAQDSIQQTLFRKSSEINTNEKSIQSALKEIHNININLISTFATLQSQLDLSPEHSVVLSAQQDMNQFNETFEKIKKFENESQTILKDIQSIETALNLSNQGDELVSDVSKFIDAPFLQGDQITDNVARQANQFYSREKRLHHGIQPFIDRQTELDRLKASCTAYPEIRLQNEAYLDAKQREFDQCMENLENKRLAYFAYLYCHLIVRSLLNFDQWNQSNQGNVGVSPPIYDLLEIILHPVHQGWNHQAEKASDLLKALQHYANEYRFDDEKEKAETLLYETIKQIKFPKTENNLINDFIPINTNFQRQYQNATFVKDAELNQIDLGKKKAENPEPIQFAPRLPTELNPEHGDPADGDSLGSIKIIKMKDSFFKRHWGKMFAGGIFVAFLVATGIFTGGLVPAIALGVTLASAGLISGSVAGGVGVGGLTLLGMGLGATATALAAKETKTEAGGIKGFIKKHHKKILIGLGVGLLVAGLVVVSIFTFGLAPVVAAGVAIGVGTLGISVGGGAATGISIGAIAAGITAIGTTIGALFGIGKYAKKPVIIPQASEKRVDERTPLLKDDALKNDALPQMQHISSMLRDTRDDTLDDTLSDLQDLEKSLPADVTLPNDAAIPALSRDPNAFHQPKGNFKDFEKALAGKIADICFNNDVDNYVSAQNKLKTDDAYSKTLIENYFENENNMTCGKILIDKLLQKNQFKHLKNEVYPAYKLPANNHSENLQLT